MGDTGRADHGRRDPALPVADERPEHHAYLGAVTRVDATATAFPHRPPGYSLLIVSQWRDQARTQANIARAGETFETPRPYMSGRSDVNNLSADAGQVVRDIWGINHERLVRIKRRYDPDNIFRLNHNIHPAG